MPIGPSIPTPMSGGDAFLQGAAGSQGIFDSLMKNKLVPAEIDLKRAQAMKSNMIARLINDVMGGNAMGDESSSGTSSSNSIQSDEAKHMKGNLVAGLLGLPVQTNIIDGKLVSTNPFTGTAAHQIGETPTEKSEREQKQAVGTKQQEADSAAAQKLEDAALTLKRSHSLYKQLNDILDKRPNLTGVGSGLASSLNMSSNPDLAAFQTISGRAQAELGRLGSQRGGAQVLKWAETNKPGIYKPVKYNRGIIGGTINSLQNDYNDLNEEYRAKTGKNLPFKLESSEQSESVPVSAPVSNFQATSSANESNKPIAILYKGGKEYHLPPKLMQKALKEGFSLTPGGGSNGG